MGFGLDRILLICYLHQMIGRSEILNNLKESTVLLIEDEAIIAWEVEAKLRKWGIGYIIVKESMEESRDLLLSNHCDIIISNLRLIDGWIDYHFAELLKKGKTHLILLTGLSSMDMHKVDWRPIKPKFLFKPFTSLQLKKVLEH